MSSSFSRKMNCHERIKHIRKQLGLTQEAFAEQLDISYSAYKKLESGENIPSIDTLYKFKQKFQVSADYLLFDELNSADVTWERFLNSSVQEQMELYHRILYYFSNLKQINFLSQQEQQELIDYINRVFPPNETP